MSSFCVFVPVKDGMPLIKDTINSILQQRRHFFSNITVVVCEALSSDGTAEYLQTISSDMKSHEIDFYIISRKDSGMYDGLAYGMAKVTSGHDVYCYINAGDYFSPHAFSIVSSFMKNGCNWLTGMNASYHSNGALVNLTLPCWYPQSLIKQGFFGTKLPYIQQESTFWSGTLQKKLNLEELAKYRYAGDFFIWKTFADHEELFIIHAWLGGFRRHSGQQSQVFMREYMEEFRSISDSKTLYSILLSKIIWFLLKMPPHVRRAVSRKIMVLKDPLD